MKKTSTTVRQFLEWFFQRDLESISGREFFLSGFDHSAAKKYFQGDYNGMAHFLKNHGDTLVTVTSSSEDDFITVMSFSLKGRTFTLGVIFDE